MGFISTTGSRPAAIACIAWAIPISPPSRVTYEFRLMFCDLNGAWEIPRLRRLRQSAVTTVLFPTWDAVPRTMMDMAHRFDGLGINLQRLFRRIFRKKAVYGIGQ